MSILSILQDGSDKVFYRVLIKNKTYILLRESKKYRFEQYIKISHLLNGLTPKIFDHDEGKLEILMEDLGDLSLFDYMITYKDYKIYYEVISVLKEIQKISASLPVFDLEHLLYELDYFLTYNRDYLNYKDFLYKNAEIISNFDYAFMHRDFQSRNIVIKDNKIRVIDFQNAHIGPKLYDIASLLNDPYVNLEDEMIEKLLNFYGNIDFESFLRTSLQRICQVCAAFKKLSKEKQFFKQFIAIAINKFEKLIQTLKF